MNLAHLPIVYSGDGQEYRAEFNGSIGSALSLDESVVHLNVLTPPA